MRVKIFVDFWNVVINVRKATKFPVSIRWNTLAEIIIREARDRFDDQSYPQIAGCFIFGSWSRSNSDQNKFVEATLDEYGPMAGLFLEFTERVSKETSSKCDKCGNTIKTSSEVGVDILMTVEAIKHASMREHEYIAIVSSDRDFLPLLAYLKDQGQRVIHVASGEAHREMRSATWKQIKISGFIHEICRLDEPGVMILTAPHCEVETNRVSSKLEKAGIPFKLIDITKREDISDKDLAFLLNLFYIYFYDRGNSSHQTSYRGLGLSIYELRKAIFDGKFEADLPYVIRDGSNEAWWTPRSGWISNGSARDQTIWDEIRKEYGADY
jgi:uncharacterized LabA/DUF88 family protein